jgi:hypothetical protein
MLESHGEKVTPGVMHQGSLPSRGSAFSQRRTKADTVFGRRPGRAPIERMCNNVKSTESIE